MTPMLISPDHIITSLAAAFVGLILLAIAAAPVLAVIGQQRALLQKKIFHDKLAAQIAAMATTLGCVFFTALTAGAVHTAIQNPDLFQGPYRLPIMVCMGTITFSFTLLVAYTLLWKSMRQSKSLHMLIGLFATISMISGVFLAFGLGESMLRPGHLSAGNASPLEIFTTIYTIAPTSLVWPLFLQSLLVGLGAAAMLGQIYLVLRRNRDDYGRDYYKFALPVCAGWAIAPTLLQFVPATWLFLLLKPSLGPLVQTNPVVYCWAAAALLPLIACALWVRVRNSETPMRHKAAIALALPLTLTGCAAQILALLQQAGM